MKMTFNIEIDQNMHGQKIVDVLFDFPEISAQGLSKKELKDALNKGAIWLQTQNATRRVRRGSQTVELGNKIYFYYSPEVLADEPPAPSLVEDMQDYSVWFKPYGLRCQGSKWGDHGTIQRWIETHAPFETTPQRNAFIVHRLDRAARGLILIAHKKKVAAKLAGLFEARDIEKHYRVIVEGKFPGVEKIIDSSIDEKNAISIVNLIQYNEEKNRSLLNVEIKTGRKHQIRIHMMRSGYPVVGDRLYGQGLKSSVENNTLNSDVDLQLSCFSLSFECPISNNKITFELPTKYQLHLA